MIINPYSVVAPVPFSYSNTGGTGNRTAIIATSTNASLAAGTVNTIVNGSFSANTSGSFRWNSGQSSINITFDFGSGHAPQIDQFKFSQNSGVFNEGSWKWQFSDDNSTWTDCTAGQTMTGTSVFWNATAIGSHRYYRLLQTSSSTNSGPWKEEIEFRIRGY